MEILTNLFWDWQGDSKKKKEKKKHQRLGASNNTKNEKLIWKIYTIQLLDFNTKAQ